MVIIVIFNMAIIAPFLINHEEDGVDGPTEVGVPSIVSVHETNSDGRDKSYDITIEKFEAVPRDGEIELFWSISKNDTEDVSISHYNVYKNGERVSVEESGSFLDVEVENGVTYTYRIEVICEEGEVLKVSEEIDAAPESYWWIYLAIIINIGAFLFILFYYLKKRG